MIDIGERLRLERERLGLNQTQMAELFGKHKNTQVKYESNEKSPTAATLAMLAEQGVDMHFLFYGRYAEAAATGHAHDLLSAIYALPASHQAVAFGVVSMIKAIAPVPEPQAVEASTLWQAMQLVNGFLAASPAEQATLMNTLAVLQTPGGAAG